MEKESLNQKKKISTIYDMDETDQAYVLGIERGSYLINQFFEYLYTQYKDEFKIAGFDLDTLNRSEQQLLYFKLPINGRTKESYEKLKSEHNIRDNIIFADLLRYLLHDWMINCRKNIINDLIRLYENREKENDKKEEST